MRNLIKIMAAACVGAAALLSCTRLEVTLPKGPQGEQGIQGITGRDGLTSYEVWVKAVVDGTIQDWDQSRTGLSDYFIYLKGEKGDKGDDGKTAYEVWKEYISTGDADAPQGGGKWDPEADTQKDFFKYLTGPKGDDGLIPFIGDNGDWFIGDSDTGVPATGPAGADGADGLSAYRVWLEFIKGDGDPEWSVSDTSMCYFFLYLKGEKGDKGDKGDDGDNGNTPYVGDDGNWHVGDTDTGVPATGPSGEDGMSAYELWKKEVLSKEGLENPGNGVYDQDDYPLWPKDAVDLEDFFLYLGGKDGADGLSAYELWKEYISDGNVDDPKNPGKKWDKNKDSEADFYYYLTGADGVDGLSAYELWKRDVLSESGLANPGNGVYDVEEYPTWPATAVNQADFWKYLKGKDGVDGENAVGVAGGLALSDTAYLDRVDSKMYNVASVIALSKITGGKTEYEYVNPISGGAAFIVTGPGPVIIPNCEVTFTDMSGSRTYTKTSDSQGYVYLSREELPEWQAGLPSAKDDPDNIGSGVKPISFSYGSTTVTDQSKIASTCKVPYQVGLIVVTKGATLRYYSTCTDYLVYRIVEGVTEGVHFISCREKISGGSYTQSAMGFWPSVNSSVFRYYRNKGVEILLSRVSGLAGDLASLKDDQKNDWLSDINHICGERNYEYTLHRAMVSRSRVKGGKETWFAAGFGDGASPSKVGVYDLLFERIGGEAYPGAGKVLPDYGLKLSDTDREVMNPPYFSMPNDVTGSFVWDSGHTRLSLEFSSAALSALEDTPVYNEAGKWDSDKRRFSFPASTMRTEFRSPMTSFTVSGKYNGSTVNSTVKFNLYQSLDLTDVYDGFSMSVSDFVDGSIMLAGFSGKFKYTRGEDKAYAFGHEIDAEERNVTD